MNIYFCFFIGEGLSCLSPFQPSDCVPNCPAKCNAYRGAIQPCPEVFLAVCRQGCVCPQGTALSSESSCAPITSPQCGGIRGQ